MKFLMHKTDFRVISFTEEGSHHPDYVVISADDAKKVDSDKSYGLTVLKFLAAQARDMDVANAEAAMAEAVTARPAPVSSVMPEVHLTSGQSESGTFTTKKLPDPVEVKDTATDAAVANISADEKSRYAGMDRDQLKDAATALGLTVPPHSSKNQILAILGAK